MKTWYSLTLLVFFLYLAPLCAQWTALPLPTSYLYSNVERLDGKLYALSFLQSKIKTASTADNTHWTLDTVFVAGMSNGSAVLVPAPGRLYLFVWNKFKHYASAYYRAEGTPGWKTVALPAVQAPRLFLPVADGLLFAADSAVYRSADGGVSWTPVLKTSKVIGDMKRLDDHTVLLTTPGQLFRSSDAGSHWTALPAPYSANGINYPGLAIYPTLHGTFIQLKKDTASVLYRSADAGNTWTPLAVPTNQYGYSNVQDLASGSGGLWGVMNNALYISKDSGATWERRLAPQGIQYIRAEGDTLFLSAYLGFYKSYDQGKTWFSGHVGLDQLGNGYSGAETFSLMEFRKGRLWVSSGDGLFSTDNDGVEWRLEYATDTYTNFEYLFGEGDTLVLLGAGALRSFDGGKNWALETSSDVMNNPLSGNRAFAQAGPFIFAMGWFDDYLFRSGDYGASWQLLNLPTFFPDYIAGANNKLYISDYEGVQASSDYGQSYAAFNTGFGLHFSTEGVWAAGNDLFAKVDGQLFHHNGAQWKPASAGLFDEFGYIPYIRDMAHSDDQIVLAGYANAGSTNAPPRIFRTANDGQNWEGNLGESLAGYSVALLALNSNTLYAAGDSLGYTPHLWKYQLAVSATEPDREALPCALWPNPAAGDAWLTLPEAPALPARVRVCDATGHPRWERSWDGQSALHLPLGAWPAGLYVVTVEQVDGKRTQKRLVVYR